MYFVHVTFFVRLINLGCLSISVKALSKNLFQLKRHKNADWFTHTHSSKFKPKFKLDYEISSSLKIQANITNQIILSKKA